MISARSSVFRSIRRTYLVNVHLDKCAEHLLFNGQQSLSDRSRSNTYDSISFSFFFDFPIKLNKHACRALIRRMCIHRSVLIHLSNRLDSFIRCVYACVFTLTLSITSSIDLIDKLFLLMLVKTDFHCRCCPPVCAKRYCLTVLVSCFVAPRCLSTFQLDMEENDSYVKTKLTDVISCQNENDDARIECIFTCID
jgi:hypothetical protein